jgi:thermitase
MTSHAKGPTGSRWPLPDPRTPTQHEQDKPAVRRQVAELLRPDGNAGARKKVDDLIELIRKRQLGAPPEEANRFAVFAPAGGAPPVLVAENQLVVDAGDPDLAQLDVLGDYSPADRPGRHPRRKTRVFRGRGPKNVDKLREDAQRIRREANITANVNPIVPLGYVIKGNDYPGLTTVTESFAPAAGGAPVRVAIVDTGRTAENRSDGWFTNVVRDGTDPLNIVAPLDRNDFSAGHGSFVAGIVRRVAPGCEIVVYRFTGADGLGTDEAAADLLMKAAEDGAGGRLIINASFGAPAVDDVPPVALHDAVRDISTRYPEVLIVASAGNDGGVDKLYPAGFDELGVKAVGALDSTLAAATFSNHGPWLHCSAVGVGVVSTFVKGLLPPETGLAADVNFPVDAWATWSGTSFTAPQISGAVAQLCSEDATLSPKAAFDLLIQDLPVLNGYGAIVHIMPGTDV